MTEDTIYKTGIELKKHIEKEYYKSVDIALSYYFELGRKYERENRDEKQNCSGE